MRVIIDFHMEDRRDEEELTPEDIEYSFKRMLNGDDNVLRGTRIVDKVYVIDNTESF
jgi:hypothetical protein